MFKLESYITPIILSYVEKYVKDVKVERSQVSLWNGGAAFSNLDLRLDVLEKELGLPFTFVSGHIHELYIHVPWTRLNTEPIVITINTIECVLKLPGDNDGSGGGDGTESESSIGSSSAVATSGDQYNTKHRTGGGRSTKSQQEVPPGYVQSLINKIISNVKIVCNNLILKYVEDDIVLSLNTRWLSLSSANEIWEPAFVELNAASGLVLRKLLQVKDMTICLDKRNASGKIETYQEPLLYRSSLSVHAAWCYDSPLSKVPRTTRYDIRSERLDFSLTDTQIPMFLRILNLILALYYGELHQRNNLVDENINSGNEVCSNVDVNSAALDVLMSGDQRGSSDFSEQNESWTGWAWNMSSSVGSALLPIYWEDDAAAGDVLDVPYLTIKKEKVFHVGLYVDSASLVLKLTERQREKNLFGSTKLCFSPFARIDVSGYFQEVVVKGINTCNVSGGITHIQFIPLGDCVCGARDTAYVKQENEATFIRYVCAGSDSEDKRRNFLKDSLFVKDFGHEEGNVEPKERRKIYNMDWDQHLDQVTEEVMLEKSPAIAVDYLYHFDIPEDFTSEQLSELGSDLEDSNLPEKALCRIVFGPMIIKACSGFLHRLTMLSHFLSLYDYLPYYEPSENSPSEMSKYSTSNISQKHVGDKEVEEDGIYESNQPLRVYQITAINPSVSVLFSDHSKFNISQVFLLRNANKNMPAQSPLEDLPSLNFKMEYLDAHVTYPIYPAKNVNMRSCNETRDQTKLQNYCYMKSSAKLLNVSGHLIYGDQSTTLIQPSNFQIGYKKLLLAEELKANGSQMEYEYSFEVQSLRLRSTKPQMLMAKRIVDSYHVTHPKPAKLFETTLVEDAMTKRISSLSAIVTGGRFRYSIAKYTGTCQFSICDISVNVTCVESPSSKLKIIPILSINHNQLASTLILPKSSKMSPSRVKTTSQTGLINYGNSDSLNKKVYIHGHFQFPLSSEKQDVHTLAALEAEELHVNLDPRLYDWFLYFPAKKDASSSTQQPIVNETNQNEREVSVPKTDVTFDATGASHNEMLNTPKSPGGTDVQIHGSQQQRGNKRDTRSSTGNSDKGTLRTSHKRTKGLQRSGSTLRDHKDDVDMNKHLLDLICKWFPTINTALVQIRVDFIYIFVPKKSLVQVASKNVLDTVTRAASSKVPLPLICVIFPTITVENVAHKPMIEQFLVQTPVVFPESVWNIKRDNLPWTVQLQDFAIFTISTDNIFILEPVHTSCTLGLSSRHHSNVGEDLITPTLGICLHADMTALKMSINDTQLCLSISIIEDFLLLMAKLNPDLISSTTSSCSPHDDSCVEEEVSEFGDTMSIDHHLKMSSSVGLRETSPKESEKLGDSISEKTRSVPIQSKNQHTGSTKQKFDDSNNNALSLWIQWTIPQITVAAISEAVGQNGNVVKLELDMEDFLSSFDWTPVYFQMKMRILNSNVHHFVKSQNKNIYDWKRGRFKGIVLSCNDDLTHDLHTVNVNNNNIEILPHSRHFVSTNQTFFSVTFTRAESKNVHSKWKDLLKNKTFHSLIESNERRGVKTSWDKRKRFVSEVDIKIAPIDIVIANEVMVPFFKMATHLFSVQIPNVFYGPRESCYQKSKGMWGMGISNNSLPLVYVKAKTIRILLLTRSKEECRNPDRIDLNHAALNPDMMIFKCDSFSITPQVENVLSRILIHPELYHLSRDILTVPGSHIEDRQYQLDAIGLGLFTGRWCDIERKSEKRPKPALKAMGENPALEWNDGTLTNEADKKVDEVFLMPCVVPFDLQVIFAPAIVYESPSVTDVGHSQIPIVREKLIAGISLEINAKSEIMFTISLNQISLMSLFVQESVTIYNSLLYPATASGLVTKNKKVPDSGVDGCEASEKTGQLENNLNTNIRNEAKYPRLVPTELLITGSKISFMLFKLSEGNKSGATAEDKAMWRKYRYKYRRLEIMKERGEFTADLESEEAFQTDLQNVTKISDQIMLKTEPKVDLGYVASGGSSIEEQPDLIVKIFPLLYSLIKQPHIFVSYTNARKNRFEMSFYDSSLNISPVNYFITCGGHRVPGILDYQNQLFQTKLGEPDPKSGIPPALFTLMAQDFLDPDSATLCCKIERPIKIFCNISLWKQFFNILLSVKDACGMVEIIQLVSFVGEDNLQTEQVQTSTRKEESNDLVIRKYLSNLRSISLETKQVVTSMATSIHQKISKNHGDDFAEISLGVSGIDFSCSLISKSVKNYYVVTEIKSQISCKKILSRTAIGLYSHRFLGPCTVTIDVETAWQGLCFDLDPILIIKFISDLLPIHIGPNHVLSLCRLKEYIQQHCNKNGNRKNDTKSHNTDSPLTETKYLDHEMEPETILDKVVVPPKQSFEQHYIDDLRAGAFQYVEDDKDGYQYGDEPKPYQVVFSKNPPAMTWKYPQPRTLTRVSIFPLPFKLASELGSSNFGSEQEVTCVLQYLDKCSNSYRTYSEFNLSEQNVCHLDLPLAKDLKKMTMASTWRVLLDCQDDYEDFDQLEKQIIVTPKSLVSVIRVDSYVNQTLVPRVQVSMSLAQFNIYFHNHLHFCGYSLPFPLGSKFNLDQVFPLDQKVASIRFDGTTLRLDIWLSSEGKIKSNGLCIREKHSAETIQANAQMETQIQLEYIDYSFLSAHHLLLPCKLNMKGFMLKRMKNPILIESQLHGKKAMIRLGHFASHTLSTSIGIWKTALNNFSNLKSDKDSSSNRQRDLEPMTDYVICNNTQESIRFGQADTEENLLLRPSEAHMYAWRSQRTRLKLRLCVEGLGYWRWCEPFGLSYETHSASHKIQFRSIDHGTHITTLVITMKKLHKSTESNNSQYHIIISGLISTASLLRDHLEVRAVLHKHGAALAAAATVSSTSSHDHHQQQHRTILGSFCVAPSFLLQPEYVQGIKIRLLGIGTPWSGDIPLSIEKGRRNSVLVRVPLKEKGQCLTLWCRAVEEKSGNEMSRCLLIFSPMYMSRSLLPNPISLLVYLASNSTQTAVTGATGESSTFAYELSLPGKEEAVQLETPGASDQKYSLSFQVVQGLPPSDPVAMSWGTIEKIRDKAYDIPSIDDILSDISLYGKSAAKDASYSIDAGHKNSTPSWPYVNDEVDLTEWIPSVQPRTDVQVRFVQFHPLCNTLCVDVVPWCLFINVTGVIILIKDEAPTKENVESSVFHITNKSVFVPPTTILTSTFHFGLLDDGKEWFGPPLQMTDQQWHFKRSMLMPAMDGMIPIEGVTQTYVVCGAQICYLTIQSQNQHGIRVVSLRPTFNISNCLTKPVSCASICSSNKEVSSKDSTDFLGQDIPTSSSTSDEEDGIRAEPLLYWQMIGEFNDNPIDSLQQVAFCSFHHWSSPLSLGNCRDLEHAIRKSVSLPKNINVSDDITEKGNLLAKNEAMNELIFVSIHQKQGQVYLVLQPDNQPQYVVHNGLNISLCFIENQHGDNKYVSNHEFNKIHKVCGLNSYLYSSVFVSNNLSKVESMDDAIRMAFTSSKGNSEEELDLVEQPLNWSEWFDVSSNNKYLHEYFIRIPGYGDVAIHLESHANTCHIYIEPISKLEVSAKEIRSRISSSPHLSPPPHPQLLTPVKMFGKGLPPLMSLTTSPATSETEAVETSTNGEESFVTIPALDKSMLVEDRSFHSVKSPAATLYGSCDTSLNPHNTTFGCGGNEIQATCFLDEICLVVSDDCRDSSNNIDEYIRITMDCVCLSQRPGKGYSKPLKCLNNRIPSFNDISLTIFNFQIDNQMYRKGLYDFPAILSGQEKSPLPKFRFNNCLASDFMLDMLKNNSLASLQLKFDSNIEEENNSHILKSIYMKIRPLNVCIEDIFVYKIIQIFNSFGPLHQRRKSMKKSSSKLPIEMLISSQNLARHLYLDLLKIDELSVLVNVHASLKMHIGLDQSHLHFALFERNNLFTTSYALGQSLARHYISGALFRAGWVFGSLDLIGSPAGFTRTVGEGVKDFVALPYEGIFQGPWSFISGLTNGSTSLIKHISAGTLTSMTNFASSMSRNLDRLSLDEEHCKRNQITRRSRPQGFGEGLANGLSGIGISLLGAIGGIAHHPLQAWLDPSYEKSLPTGLVSGVARGLVGVVTKPLAGAAELVSQTGQGLLHGTGWYSETSHRSTALPEPIFALPSSELKYIWKMQTPQQHSSDILFIADVTQITTATTDHNEIKEVRDNNEIKSDQMIGSTLLLTPEMLHVISVEEDVQECAYILEEIEIIDDENDPTKFILEVEAPKSEVKGYGAGFGLKSNNELHPHYVSDRVVQFVMESGAHCAVSDVDGEYSDGLGGGTSGDVAASGMNKAKKRSKSGTFSKGEKSATGKNVKGKALPFHASPIVIQAFKSIFSVALAQKLNKGFEIL